MLLELGLHLPSTFHGGGGTWKSARASDLETAVRLDYVGLPLEWFHAVRRTYVSTESPLGLGDAEDHSMAVVEIELPCKSHSKSQITGGNFSVMYHGKHSSA